MPRETRTEHVRPGGGWYATYRDPDGATWTDPVIGWHITVTVNNEDEREYVGGQPLTADSGVEVGADNPWTNAVAYWHPDRKRVDVPDDLLRLLQLRGEAVAATAARCDQQPEPN